MDYFTKLLFTIAVCLISIEALAETTFTVESNADDSHRIVLNSDEVSDLNAAQVLIAERASELCAGQFVILGEYEFSKTEVLDAAADQLPISFEMNQEITCADEPAESPSDLNNAESVFVADDGLITQAESAFDSYKGLLNEKAYKAAYEMLTDAYQELSPYKYWKKDKKAFRKSAGGAGEFVDLKLTWYKDPPDAVGPGIYVVFDFNCVYRKLARCSGVLIFHLAESGEFKVIREEIDMLDKKTAEWIDEINFSVKPHKTAEISRLQWENYYQLATILYSDTVYNGDDWCITQVEADDILANIYFTQPCHLAHPAWVTIYVVEENQHIRLGQTGYFAGNEAAFAEMFRIYGILREDMIEGLMKVVQ